MLGIDACIVGINMLMRYDSHVFEAHWRTLECIGGDTSLTKLYQNIE